MDQEISDSVEKEINNENQNLDFLNDFFFIPIDITPPCFYESSGID
jgi:hypothetical protein